MSDMDNLIIALKFATSQNQSEIKDAEKYFETAKREKKYLSKLLLAVDMKDLPSQSRLIASIQLKNHIDFFWKFTEDEEENKSLVLNPSKEEIIVISNEEKSIFKERIAGIIGNCELKVVMKSLLESCLKPIKFDFKTWRNSLMNDITNLLNTNQESYIYAGLSLYYQISKIYEYDKESNRKVYLETFNNMINGLTTFADNLKDKLDNQVGIVILKKILNIFNKSIQSQLPIVLLDQQIFEKWLFILMSILSSLTGKEVNSSEEDSFESPYWKVGITTMSIIHKIFQKYSSPSMTDTQQMKAFCLLIDEKYGGEVVNVLFNLLEKSKYQQFPDNIICLIYKFFSRLVTKKMHMDKINPKLDILLQDYIIQGMILNKKEVLLRNDDQKEYIYKQFDLSLSFYDKRTAISQFIKSLCDNGVGKNEYFKGIFTYIKGLFENYSNEEKGNNKPNPLIKEAVMYLFESIANIAISNKVNSEIELIIKDYILPEISISNTVKPSSGILKERAAFVIKAYKKIDYSEAGLLENIIKSLCGLLSDKELSIRVFSAITLPSLILKPACKTLLIGYVKDILSVYLNLMNEIDFEELLIGLETIIEHFGESISDYAVDLCKELTRQFNRLVKVSVEEDNGEGQMAAEGAITALNRVVSVVSNNQNIFSQIEIIIDSVVKYTLSQDGFEMLDNGLELIRTVLSKSAKPTVLTWSYFTLLCYSLIGDDEENKEILSKYPDSQLEGIGYENMTEILVILHLFISKDPMSFMTLDDLTGKKYIERFFLTTNQIITNSKGSKDIYEVRINIIRCYIAFVDSFTFFNSHGSSFDIQVFVEHMIKFTLTDMKRLKKVHFSYKSSLLQLISSCFLFNSLLSLTIISNSHDSEYLLSQWLSHLLELKKEFHISKALFGLISLLSLYNDFQRFGLDPTRHGLVVFEKIVFSSDVIVKQRSKVKTGLSKEESDEKDDKLEEFLRKAKENMNKDDDEDEYVNDDEDDIDDYDEFEEMIQADEYRTGIEKEDVLLYLKGVLTKINNENSQYYINLVAGLSQNMQVCLKNLVESV